MDRGAEISLYYFLLIIDHPEEKPADIVFSMECSSACSGTSGPPGSVKDINLGISLPSISANFNDYVVHPTDPKGSCFFLQ